MFKLLRLVKRVETLENKVQELTKLINEMWEETHPPVMGGK